MNNTYDKLTRCLSAIRAKTAFTPRVGLVLGSGLGGYAERVRAEAVIGYGELDGFPVSTVPGHAGRFVFGHIGETPVVVMQGRVHYYEGYPISDVVLPVRLMGLLGATTVILTNAVGAINAALSPGELMLITDHILWGVPSPLIGENIDALGTRFPDMSEVYSKSLAAIAESAANAVGVPLKRGVYLQTSGPNFETPAEIRAFRALGADVVGMSTACEAVAARHMGLSVLGLSCVSNLAAGISDSPLSHEEVQLAADEASPRFRALLDGVIEAL